MAISVSTVPAGAQTMRSVGLIEIYTPGVGDPMDGRIVLHMQDVMCDAQGKPLPGAEVKFPTQRVERRVGDVVGEEGIPALMTSIKTKAYAWVAETNKREADAAAKRIADQKAAEEAEAARNAKAAQDAADIKAAQDAAKAAADAEESA